MLTLTRLRKFTHDTYFGWWIVGGSVLMQIVHSALLMQSYGLYVAILQEEFLWSKTILASAFALRQAERGLLAPVVGWSLDKFGSQRVMRFGLIILGFSFLLFSQVNSLLTFFAVTLLMGFGASFGGHLALTTTIVQWFEKRRATALATSQIGMSVGGLLIPLVALSMANYGWRPTAFVSGIIIMLVCLPLTRIMRSRPEDYGLLPDGQKIQANQDLSKDSSNADGLKSQDYSARQALRTQAFWFLSLGHASALLIVSSVTVHLVLHLNEGLGYSLQSAASVFALMTAFMIVGQLLGGYLGDRFSKKGIAAVAMFGHATALLALAYATSSIGVIYFAVAHGLSWGMRGPLMSALRADFFGRKSFGSILGISALVVTVGSVTGPVLAGIMADTFGNYRTGFTILAGLAACGSIFFIMLKKPQK